MCVSPPHRGAARDQPSMQLNAEPMEILKADAASQMVWAWASVITEKGRPVVDSHGHVIEPGELVEAATDFMADARMAKAMHKGGKVGEVIHSFPLTYELAKLFGIETEREGWLTAIKVHDPEIWKRAEAGELPALSIGGSAILEDYEAA